MALRKRDGGTGQLASVVPYDFQFNAEAIKGYLAPELAEGVLVENIITLLQLDFIEVANAKGADRIIGGTKYQIKYPDAAIA